MKEDNISGKVMRLSRTSWIVMIGIILVGAILLWKNYSERALEQSFAEKEKVTIARANSQIKAERGQTMEMILMTFVWAIRSEMLRGNMETVDQYLNHFVKEIGIEQVALTDPEGRILLCTDKKMEGKSFSEFHPSIILDANSNMVVEKDSNSVYVFGPVMGLNKKLGTLMFIYQGKRIEAD